ncbi:MAG TPA: hypothetical protein VF191_13740 [Cyclobacteriaceae bacterium]
MTQDRLFGIVLFWMAAAFVPGAIIFEITHMHGSIWFCIGMGVYFFVYRPVIATFRLLSLGVIDKKEAWKSLLPFWAERYRWYLWLG